MKKKISVFALLLSLFCSFIFNFTSPINTYADVDYYVPLEYSRDYIVILYNSNWNYIMFVSDEPFYIGGSGSFYSYTDNGILVLSCNNLSEGCWVLEEIKNDVYTGYNKDTYRASNHNIYNGNPDAVGELFKAQNIVTYTGDYSFPLWCLDAGLTYKSSSNEINSVYPYLFNDYIHIVRRTSTDKYGRCLLTTIGNSVYAENPEDYTVMVDENGNIDVFCLYSGDDVNGYQLFVRNYVYDTDGWRLTSYESFNILEDDDYIIELGEDSLINDYSLLAFSSVDIYSSNFYLVHEASTEFIDINDLLPIVPDSPVVPDSPTLTPTTAPGSGSGSSGSGRPGSGTRPDTGGQATGGGGLDFIINLFTLIWTKICSIPMAVDGYSISLQQIVIYGALVSIVGGFIMHFIFGRK